MPAKLMFFHTSMPVTFIPQPGELWAVDLMATICNECDFPHYSGALSPAVCLVCPKHNTSEFLNSLFCVTGVGEQRGVVTKTPIVIDKERFGGK